MTTEEYLSRRKSRDWNFNEVVSDKAFENVKKIHPLKQRQVRDIVNVAKTDPHVKRVIIFGSSIRYDCDITSDLDLCIDWNEDCYDSDGVLKPFTRNMRQIITKATKGNADVVNYQYLSGTAVENDAKNGVVVYEHNV